MRVLLQIAATTAALTVTQGITAAAGNAPALEEVVVTATKRSEPLQDVPIAVSAITAEDIQQRGFTQFADYINTIPGVYFQDGGPGNSIIHVRGASESGVGSTVATYFGDTLTSVFTNHGGQPNVRLVDIDRIEVLRGPQGTIYGANTLVGVLRVVPAAPDVSQFDLDLGTRGFTTAHSSDESYHVEGVVNVPLVQDRLALRVVGYKDDIAGYIDNIAPTRDAVDYSEVFELPSDTLVTPAFGASRQRDINAEETWGGRAALRWQASDQLRIDVSHLTQHATLNSEPFTVPAAGDYAQSSSLFPLIRGGYGERLNITGTGLAYDWENLSLVSSSNWMQMHRQSYQDLTFLALAQVGAPIPWFYLDESFGKLFTQEVRLQSRGDAPLQWTFGFFYFREKADMRQHAADLSCPTCLGTVFLEQDFALDIPRARQLNETQRSVFGEVSLRFARLWTVGVGARYLEDEIESFDIPTFGFLALGSPEPGPPRTGKVYEFNPSAYLRLEPTDAMTFYLQAGRGFRSGDVNDPLPDACQEQVAGLGIKETTDPDTLWNYELGMKARFAGGRLGVNAAVYKSDWKDVQLSLGLDCAFSGIVNGGDIDGKGAELEIIAQPTDAWQLNLALSYNKSRFDNVIPGTAFVPGERLPDAPEKNMSAGAQYSFPLGGQWTGFARADYVYVGDVRVKFASDPPILQDAYDVVNARLGFQRDNLAVELFGRNLTDERAVSVTAEPSFGGYQTIIRPREIGVELRYSFR
jgi:iron complex outermembrane recepter protein